MAISTTQRGAFGRRYWGGSPFGAERNRLVNEYGLAPNRAAIGMQASQGAEALAQNQSQWERSFAQQQANFQKQMDLQGSGMGGPDYGNVPGAYGYLSRYPEVAGNLYFAKDPYAHYLQYGKNEGKTWVGDAPPEWSEDEKAAFYMYMYPEVRNDPNHITAQRHYELFGKAAGLFWPSRVKA